MIEPANARRREAFRGSRCVGCGRISKNHFDAIAPGRRPRARAPCATSIRSARSAPASRRACPSFTSYEEMLQGSECDVVTIATPSGLHSAAGQSRRRRAGKHVVTEKPMAISLGAGGRAGAGVRRGRRPSLRREAEPAEPADPAAQARGRQGPLRPDLHGEQHGPLGAAAGVLRRGAVARHMGVRRRRVHESGVALRRSDPVARGSGGERDGARPRRRRAGSRRRTPASRSSSSGPARSASSR